MEGNWNGAQGNNKYQYNQKEWNDDFGLGWNDYGARMYDPAMSRWVATDPLAEQYLNYSPFCYTLSNPIKFIDPNGMEVFNIAGGTRYTGDDAISTFDALVSQAKRGGWYERIPTLNEIIKYGKEHSTTFKSLLEEAGENNITIVNNGHSETDPSTGAIKLVKHTDIQYMVIKLTHELTNRINRKKFLQNLKNLVDNTIKAQEAGQKVADLEKLGVINQIKVASEIGFKYKEEYMPNGYDGLDKLNTLIDDYHKNDKIDLSSKLTPNSMYTEDYAKSAEAAAIKIRTHNKSIKEYNKMYKKNIPLKPLEPQIK
jgi:RHS repeat-associated protein